MITKHKKCKFLIPKNFQRISAKEKFYRRRKTDYFINTVKKVDSKKKIRGLERKKRMKIRGKPQTEDFSTREKRNKNGGWERETSTQTRINHTHTYTQKTVDFSVLITRLEWISICIKVIIRTSKPNLVF